METVGFILLLDKEKITWFNERKIDLNKAIDVLLARYIADSTKDIPTDEE